MFHKEIYSAFTDALHAVPNFHDMFLQIMKPFLCHFNSQSSLINHFLKPITERRMHTHRTPNDTACNFGMFHAC